MTISEIKKDAKVKLSGNYKKAFVICLINFLIVFAFTSIADLVNNVFVKLISQIIVLIISLPLSFGLISSFMKILRNEDVKVFDFVETGFKNFKGVWRTYLRTIVNLILPVILLVASYIFLIYTLIQALMSSATSVSNLFLVALVLVIVAIVFFIYKSLSYSLTLYVLYDNPTATGKETNNESKKMMKGNKGKLFLLSLSFIGWLLLIGLVTSLAAFLGEEACIIVSSLGSLLLSPYMTSSIICFYEDLKSNDEPIKESE